MQQIRIMSALLLISSLSLISCKKDSDENNNNCTNTTNWVKNGYKFAYVNYPIYISADSLFAELTEVSPGIFKSDSKYDNTPPTSVYLQPCGNSIYQSSSSSMSDKQEVYRLDGNVGETWSSTIPTSGGYTATNTTTIVAKNVSVTVPAGTFNCIKLRMESTSSNPYALSVTTDFYLDKDYGPVKAEGTSVHYELDNTNF